MSAVLYAKRGRPRKLTDEQAMTARRLFVRRDALDRAIREFVADLGVRRNTVREAALRFERERQ